MSSNDYDALPYRRWRACIRAMQQIQQQSQQRGG